MGNIPHSPQQSGLQKSVGHFSFIVSPKFPKTNSVTSIKQAALCSSMKPSNTQIAYEMTMLFLRVFQGMDHLDLISELCFITKPRKLDKNSRGS